MACSLFLTPVLINSLQFYLPPEGLVNKDFLKDVLTGKKQLYQKSAITPIQVPHYDELSVKALYPQFKEDPIFLSYFPDKYPKDKGPPREYFFNILNTLYPDYLSQVMSHANKQRMSTEGEDVKAQSIQISQYWSEQLSSMPYLSRKYLLLLPEFNPSMLP